MYENLSRGIIGRKRDLYNFNEIKDHTIIFYTSLKEMEIGTLGSKHFFAINTMLYFSYVK